MPEKKWFYIEEGQVKGPVTFTDLEGQSFANNTLFWCRGQPEWISQDRWKICIEAEKVEVKDEEVERLWKIKIKDKEWAAMPHAEMIKSLKTMTDLTDVMVWTEGYQSWREIFQIHKIMDELGVSRRQHPRVPIVGTLTYDVDKKPFAAKLCTMSEGGCGATETKNLVMGTKIKALIESPQLPQSMTINAEVVFVGKDGYAGLRFLGLNSEFKSLIIEYVRKFSERTTLRS